MAGSGAVFVLWGEGCDETLAVAWVSRLRAEGRRVYLVGVSGRHTRGKFGVGLAVDIGLDEALGLVEEAELVVLPCAEEVAHSFRRDPRFEQFLALAAAHAQEVHGVVVTAEMAVEIAKKIQE